MNPSLLFLLSLVAIGFFIIAGLQHLMIGILLNWKKLNLIVGLLTFVWAIYEINIICVLKCKKEEEFISFYNAFKIISLVSFFLQLLVLSNFFKITRSKFLHIIVVFSVSTMLLLLFFPFLASHFKIQHMPFNQNTISAPNTAHVEWSVPFMMFYLTLILDLIYALFILINHYRLKPGKFPIILFISLCIQTFFITYNSFSITPPSTIHLYLCVDVILKLIIVHFLCMEFINGEAIAEKIEHDHAVRKFKVQAIQSIADHFKAPLDNLSNIGSTDTKENILDVTKTNSTHMLNLVENILEIYKYNDGAFKLDTSICNFNQVLNESFKYYSINIKKIDYLFEGTNDFLVEIDKKNFHKAIVNLLNIIVSPHDAEIPIKVSIKKLIGHQLKIRIQHKSIHPIFIRKHYISNLIKTDSKDISYYTRVSLSFSKIVIEAHNGKLKFETKNTNEAMVQIRLKYIKEL